MNEKLKRMRENFIILMIDIYSFIIIKTFE